MVLFKLPKTDTYVLTMVKRLIFLLPSLTFFLKCFLGIVDLLTIRVRGLTYTDMCTNSYCYSVHENLSTENGYLKKIIYSASHNKYVVHLIR